jgi:hypothetical protein
MPKKSHQLHTAPEARAQPLYFFFRGLWSNFDGTKSRQLDFPFPEVRALLHFLYSASSTRSGCWDCHGFCPELCSVMSVPLSTDSASVAVRQMAHLPLPSLHQSINFSAVSSLPPPLLPQRFLHAPCCLNQCRTCNNIT